MQGSVGRVAGARPNRRVELVKCLLSRWCSSRAHRLASGNARLELGKDKARRQEQQERGEEMDKNKERDREQRKSVFQ